MMAALGVRNIAQFNERVDEALAAGETTLPAEARSPARPRASRSDSQRIPYIVVVIDELADLMVVVGARRRGVAAAARADGARRRHPPRARDAAAERRRADGRHQGELPGAHLVPGLVADRLAHDPRPERRRAPARPGRHAVPAARHLEAPAHARRLRLGARGGASWSTFLRKQGAPQFDESLIRAARGGRETEERAARTSTSCTTAPSRSSPRRATPRSPTSSAGSRSATTARRA